MSTVNIVEVKVPHGPTCFIKFWPDIKTKNNFYKTSPLF